MTFDYIYDFFKIYKGKRKYASLSIVSGHSFFEKNHEFIDEHLVKFLENLEREGFLKNTIIQLYSDHGDHAHRFLTETPSGKIERMQPIHFTVIPDKVEEKYGDNLIANTNKLHTHYEIFETAQQYTKQKKYIDPTYEPYIKAYSVLHQKIPAGRSCKDLFLKSQNDCRCFI